MADVDDYVILVCPMREEDGGGFFGFVPDLQGCMSHGDTQEEALANVRQAAREWLATSQEYDKHIPEPGWSAKRDAEERDGLVDAIALLTDMLKDETNRADENYRMLLTALKRLHDGRHDIPIPRNWIATRSKLSVAHH